MEVRPAPGQKRPRDSDEVEIIEAFAESGRQTFRDAYGATQAPARFDRGSTKSSKAPQRLHSCSVRLCAKARAAPQDLNFEAPDVSDEDRYAKHFAKQGYGFLLDA